MFKFDKLNNSNYRSWEYKMRMLLEKEEVWKFVHAPAEDTEEWNSGSRKALTIIALSVEDQQLIHIRYLNTGKEAWEALKSQHSHSTFGSIGRVMCNLFGKKYEKGESMRDHLDKLFGWIDELQEAGTSLDNKVKVGLILSSVNKEFANLVTALEAWDTEKVTLEAIKGKLIDEWQKREAEEKSTEATGYGVRYDKRRQGFARDDQRQLSSSGNVTDAASRDGFLCHFCRQSGHFRKDCPDLRRKLNRVRQEKANECKEKEDMNKEEDTAKKAYVMELYKALHIAGSRKLADSWFIDSGASAHMCGNKESFSEIDLNHNSRVVVGNGERIEAKGKGKVRIFIDTNKGKREVELQDVLWVPELYDNLISVSKLTKGNKSVEFVDNRCYLKDGSLRLQIGTKDGGLYKILEAERVFSATPETIFNVERCIHDWHKRLAHRNLADIKAMKKEGLLIKECEHSDDCEACIKGKMSRRPFPKVATPTRNALDCIVSDICGPLQVESLGRKRYFITFTDIYSGFTKVYGIREKSDAVATSIEFIESMKTQFGIKPKTFRTDRGLEYLNDKLQSYLRSEGIKTQCTVGYAPEQNGVAERKNRTLMEAARSMLAESGLPKQFWAEAIGTANFVFNRIINRKKGKSPYELFYNKKPTQTYFHEFGCDVYAMVPTEKRRKLDDKAIKMKFIGYDDQAKGYRLVDGNNKIHISREVRFLSTKSNFETQNGKIDNTNEVEVTFDWPQEPEEEFFDAENYDDEEEAQLEEENQEELTDDDAQEQEEAPRRSERTTAGQMPTRFGDYVMYKVDGSQQEPKTYKEALKSKESHSWMEAMKEELDSINANQTWELTELPLGRKAIGSKWVYKHKRDESGKIIRHKARLVAQGFSQKYGVDYNEVFAPVARSTTLRLLLSVSGKRKYIVNHYDIKTAFLNGKLTEEIYMKQPPGFEKGDKVFKLRKSLYGLKQSARVWNQTLHDALTKNGCRQNETDRCLYVKKLNGKVIYVLIHVDDLLVATNDREFMDVLMNQVGKCFELKNLGEVRHYLGIDIKRENGKFLISQGSYIDSIIEEAKLADAKISKFPLDTGYYKQEGKILPSNDEYRKLIGMLLYLTTHTRPDIAASVSILSKRVEKPRENDLVEVKRVIRYLKGTRNLVLQLNGNKLEEDLHAYSDANWAEDREDRKSNSGYYCSANGGTISWCSRKQDTIALSSAEAEYIALTETCKEVTWIVEIAREFDLKMPEKVTVFTDSQSCISMIDNQKFSNRTKHIATKYHYIREQVTNGKIKLEYVPSQENTADLMTKPLGSTKTEALRRLAGLRDLKEV